MLHVRNILHRQTSLLVSNQLQSIIFVAVAALLPYTTWMSVTVMALITLRNGAYQGAVLFFVAGIVHSICSTQALSGELAFLSTFLVFFPCYLAANLLRQTASWRMVSGGFFLMIMVIMVALQTMYPEFSILQLAHFKSIVEQLPKDNPLMSLLDNGNQFTDVVFANYLVGIQAVGIVSSAMISLLFARALQSVLFYPGGFKKELFDYRGEWPELVLFFALLLAATYNNVLAMNLLPAMIFYFLLSGLSLGLNFLINKKPITMFLLLIVPLFLMPLVMLPMYVIMGLLDTIFNVRGYLARSCS